MLTEDTPPSPEQVVRPSAWMPLQLPGSDWLCSDASEFEAKTI